MNTKQPASTNIRVSRDAHYALHALAALRKEPMSATLLFLVNRALAEFERRVADKVNKQREERQNKQEEAECHQ